MADERAGREIDKDNPSKTGHVQTAGRKENAAQPLNAADDNGGAERYPPTRADDAIERSFEPKTRNETAPGEGRPDPAKGSAEGKSD
jgi:hypothetical protein